MVFYTPFHPPKHKDQPPKADLRREITPWRALVWAYADECLVAATNGMTADRAGSDGCADNGWAQARYEERAARGTINGLLPAHEDAFAIDVWLYRSCIDIDHRYYFDIRHAVGKRMFILQGSDLAPLRCGPVLNEKNKPKMLYPISGRNEPYLCMVTYTGYSSEQIDAQQKLYETFLQLMADMVGLRLTMWKITP